MSASEESLLSSPTRLRRRRNKKKDSLIKSEPFYLSPTNSNNRSSITRSAYRKKSKMVEEVTIIDSSSSENVESDLEGYQEESSTGDDIVSLETSNNEETESLESETNENETSSSDEKTNKKIKNIGGTNAFLFKFAPTNKISQVQNQNLDPTPSSNFLTTHSAFEREKVLVYNREAYFKAKNRIKFKKFKIQKNEKPKKPRKGNRVGRDTENNLPYQSTADFSVSKIFENLILDHEKELHSKHQEEIANLQNKIEAQFPNWIYLLRENFNLLLHGYGSKEEIFKSFKKLLNDGYFVMTINGRAPKINTRKLLLDFWSYFDLKVTLKLNHINKLPSLADKMFRYLNEIDHDSIFFLVYNMESLAAQHPLLFQAISTLSKIRYIHIIASVDHINPLLYISSMQITRMNLCWVDCTTFVPYHSELEGSKVGLSRTLKKSDGEKAGLEHVLKSSTANAKDAFKTLVKLQLENLEKLDGKSRKDFGGVEFTELASKCRQKMIATSEINLRTLLTEFIDHHFIKLVGKSKKADNLLLVELDFETLQKIANES